MRIAQIAPLYEPVPPRGYGGTERVVSHLTEQLVSMGHDVTLFASGDSETRATLRPIVPRALRLAGALDPVSPHVAAVERVFREAATGAFDVLHFHVDALHFPLLRRHHVPAVTTLHGRLDLPELLPLYHEFPEMPVVSISQAQRAPLPWLNWQATVHHGMPLRALAGGNPSHGRAARAAGEGGLDSRWRPEPRQRGEGERGQAGSREGAGYPEGPGHPEGPGVVEPYLLFLGRLSPEKGVERAVAIARRTGKRLVVAGKVDRVDRPYFEERLVPLLRKPWATFLGEVDEERKRALLREAEALLFPIRWPEPFGLIMVEAMAMGTPVIAFRHGSVPEIVEHGVTGFVVDDLDQACEAVHGIHRLDRATVRAACEARFDVGRMARDYLRVYERLLEAANAPRPAAVPRRAAAAPPAVPPGPLRVAAIAPDPRTPARIKAAAGKPALLPAAPGVEEGQGPTAGE